MLGKTLADDILKYCTHFFQKMDFDILYKFLVTISVA